jgi:hypothetical protein
MARWMLAVIAAFFVVFCATVLLTGDAIYLVPAVILAAIVLAYALANRALTHRVARRHGSMAQALQDERDGIPSAHVIGDDDTAVGDTTEAHDEITAHDLPKSTRAAGPPRLAPRDTRAPRRATASCWTPHRGGLTTSARRSCGPTRAADAPTARTVPAATLRRTGAHRARRGPRARRGSGCAAA